MNLAYRPRRTDLAWAGLGIAFGVSMSAGASKSAAAPRIASAARGKPLRDS